MARKAEGRRKRSASEADEGRSDAVSVLYDEIVKARDRLAELPPVTPQDLESVAQAMHEVIWYLITPPTGAKTDLALGPETKRSLVQAARNRDIDLYVTVTALLARKLALQRREANLASTQLDALKDALDALTFDYRAPKRATLTLLRDIKSDLEARIAYVLAFKKTGYCFLERPESYRSRKNKAEGPDQFFRRVYGSHVRRGLTQADIRKVDPAFYNVLHVWCTRHDRKLASLVPATRPRRAG
jgi:hypothetical protein